MKPARTPSVRALGIVLALTGLTACAGAPAASTPPETNANSPAALITVSASPSVTPTPTLTPTPSSTFAITSSRVITAAGIGNLTVGLSLSEGIARRMVVPNPDLTCGDVDTDALLQALPDVHTDWTPSGLRALLVSNTEYATEAGVRVGDTLAKLKQAYGSKLQFVARDSDHFANLGGLAGPLGTRFGATLPVVQSGDAFLMFPIYAGTVDHIEIGRRDASGKFVPFVGQC